jgi:N-methylhydantoinase B/oxoprolinase/acetone carboxylase alpha subunit
MALPLFSLSTVWTNQDTMAYAVSSGHCYWAEMGNRVYATVESLLDTADNRGHVTESRPICGRGADVKGVLLTIHRNGKMPRTNLWCSFA